jgi:hypothetical protein
MGVEVRDYLSNTENELSSVRLYFILLFDLVIGQSGFEVLPVDFGQFHEIIEYEVIDFSEVPAIGSQLILQDLDFAGENHD